MYRPNAFLPYQQHQALGFFADSKKTELPVFTHITHDSFKARYFKKFFLVFSKLVGLLPTRHG